MRHARTRKQSTNLNRPFGCDAVLVRPCTPVANARGGDERRAVQSNNRLRVLGSSCCHKEYACEHKRSLVDSHLPIECGTNTNEWALLGLAGPCCALLRPAAHWRALGAISCGFMAPPAAAPRRPRAAELAGRSTRMERASTPYVGRHATRAQRKFSAHVQTLVRNRSTIKEPCSKSKATAQWPWIPPA